MRMQLNFNTAFHPQTDGKSEQIIQTLKDMLQLYVLDFEGSWDWYLPLIEFTYNNSYRLLIAIAPYKALYRRKCRLPVCWIEIEKRQIKVPELIIKIIEKVSIIQKRVKTAFSRQKGYEDPK